MKKETNNSFDIDKHVKEFNKYYYNFLQITLSDLPARMCPYLQFSEGKDCYTNDEIINIGKQFVTADAEEDAIMEILYVLGHEAQHVKSSPRKYWIWAQENGMRILVDYMSMTLLGVHCKDAVFFCKEANKRGYHFSERGLQELIHFVQNSLEDGRIEKIRCGKSRLFRDEMYIYRGKSWANNPVQKGMPELLVILNQILNLSTMGIYQKGYQAMYAGTQVDLFVDELLPQIAKCINARSCYDCGLMATDIYKALAPYVIEYFKDNDVDKLMKELQKTGQAGVGTPSQYNGNSDSEEFNESGENANGKSGKEGKDKSGKDDGKNASGKKSEDGENTGKTAKKSDLTGEEFDETNSDKSEGKLSDKLLDYFGIKTVDPDAKRPEMSDQEIEDWLNSMREQAREALHDEVKEVQSYGARKVPSIKEVFDESAPVKPLENSTCSEKFRFEEKKRTYPIDLLMPHTLEQRAKAFARKLEKIFEAEEVPELENRMSGSVNSKEIYKIAVGELDFWKKTEETGELNSCCYFLCDNSGSMGHGRNSKRSYALETLAVIEEGFKKYMPLKITAFQEIGNKVVHECVKGWEERYNNSCSFNYLMHTPTGAGNADGYSIRVATQELLSRPEAQKILFVLSDGMPAYHNGESDTALAAKEARDKGIIVVPIYFSHDTCADGTVDLNTSEAKAFASMYAKNYIITTPEEIENNVVRILSKLVLNNL